MFFWFLLSEPTRSGFPFVCIQMSSFAFTIFELPNPTCAPMLLSDRIFSRLNRAAIRNFSLILQTRKHTKLRPDPVHENLGFIYLFPCPDFP